MTVAAEKEGYSQAQIKAWQEKRNKATTEMRTILKEAGNDGLTPEKKEQFDKWDAEQQECLDLMNMAVRANQATDAEMPEFGSSEELRALEKADALLVGPTTEEEIAQQQRALEVPDDRKGRLLTAREHGQVFRGWACGDRATPEMRNLGQRAGWDFRANQIDLRWHNRLDDYGYPIALGQGTYDEIRAHYKSQLEMRQQAGGPGAPAGAGYETVPDEMMKPLEEAIKTIGGLREASTVITTATGAPMPWPTLDDTGIVAAIVAENAQVTATDMTFAQVVMGAYKYSTLVLASVEFLQDTSINANEVIGRNLGIRIARGTNAHFTTGTGSGQPSGVVTGSTLGKTAAANTGFTYKELLDLKHSLDPAYAEAPSTRWMINYATLGLMKQMVTDAGYVLWQPSMVPDAPDRFDGTRILINQDTDSVGASANPVLCGDFSKYIIRETLGVTMMRLVERWADYHQVGFLAFARYDGVLLDAGTNPIKHMTMPA